MKRILITLVSVLFISASITAGQPQTGNDNMILGTWYCAGPFKNKLTGLHLDEFNVKFPPELPVLAAGRSMADLSASWSSKTFPGVKDSLRRWVKHDEWVDGYVNPLPTGSAPMKNETCYLYRTITCGAATHPEMRVYALDDVQAWLNGVSLGVANNPDRHGSSRLPASLIVRLPLESGDNRLLVKVTSMHGAHGFAFALPPLTPSNNFRPGWGIQSTVPVQEPDFLFDVNPVPMFDPPTLKMAVALEKATSTPAGKAYLELLQKLKTDAAAGKVAATKAIEDFWSGQEKALPPVVFIRCPPFEINAIAPYTSRGAFPSDICVFDPGHPELPPRVVFHDPKMAIYDMNLSYDARTIFFSARNENGPWHIHEINADGTGLKQITDGNSSNISPLLLTSGELMFVSTRAGAHVVCQQGESGLLYVCNRDGTNVRKVSGNTLSDHSPQIMNDGRVMFTRWDYGVDKNVFCRQKIWIMNPDGTRFQLFFGNTIEDPNGFWQARAIPGRSELVCVLGPHHNYQSGMIGLVWNEMGIEAPRGEGFRWVTKELPSIGDITLPWGYRNPYPLNEHQFLASWGGDGGKKNRLYLLDDRGNRRCIYEAEGTLGCWNPMVLAARTVPPVIPSQCNNPEWQYRDPLELELDPADSLQGTFLLQDVYDGIGEDVKRGEIKALQIMEQLPRGRPNSGEQIFGHGTVVGRGTMHVRRILGVVPVESDGSAHFTAPAIRDISFNALDAEGRVVRYMGSTTQVMPDERIACVGCHDRRGYSPPTRKDKTPIAAGRAPDVPRYPSWTHKGIVEFCSVVQPVLDAKCAKCHSGPNPKGALDLSGDRTHLFNMAYDSLLDRGLVHYLPVAGTGHTEDTAKARGAYVSRLREFIETKHSGAVLPQEERQRIYTWIDANVPYYGTTRFHDATTLGTRDRWFVDNPNQWFNKEFVPVFNRRCLECHKRYIKPQTYNYNPGGDGSILVTSKRWTDLALGQFELGHGRLSGIGQYGPDDRINLTHPEWSHMLTAPLAKAAGGTGMCRTRDNQPVFNNQDDPDYQAMLNSLQKGKAACDADPREDEFMLKSGLK